MQLRKPITPFDHPTQRLLRRHPDLDLVAIAAEFAAEATGTKAPGAALRAVEEHHGRVFDASSNLIEEQHERDLAAARVEDLHERLARAEIDRATVPTTLEIPPPDDDLRPWSVGSMLEFGVWSGAAALLLFLGVSAMRIALQATGLPAFESGTNATLGATGAIVAAVALKALGTLVPAATRPSYFQLLGLIAALAGITWVVLFAFNFQAGLDPNAAGGFDINAYVDATFSGSSDSSSSSNGAGKFGRTVLLAAQVVGEICASACCFHLASRVAARHGGPRTVTNPEAAALDEVCDELRDELARAEGRLVPLLGACERQEAARAAFVAQAAHRLELARLGIGGLVREGALLPPPDDASPDDEEDSDRITVDLTTHTQREAFRLDDLLDHPGADTSAAGGPSNHRNGN